MAAALAEDGFYLCLKVGQQLDRHESLNCARKSAAVDADCATAVQDVLGGGDGHSHLLMLLVPGGDDVLQILPAAQAGLVDQLQEGVKVSGTQGFHLLGHAVVVGVDVERAQDGTVAALSAALGQLGKERLERDLAQDLAAADRSHRAAVRRNGSILVG